MRIPTLSLVSFWHVFIILLLSTFVSNILRYIFCKQHISVNICLSTHTFSLLAFSVIIDIDFSFCHIYLLFPFVPAFFASFFFLLASKDENFSCSPIPGPARPPVLIRLILCRPVLGGHGDLLGQQMVSTYLTTFPSDRLLQHLLDFSFNTSQKALLCEEFCTARCPKPCIPENIFFMASYLNDSLLGYKILCSVSSVPLKHDSL